jgi:hypothetical protein
VRFFRKDERNTRCIGFPFLSRVLSLCVDDSISLFYIFGSKNKCTNQASFGIDDASCRLHWSAVALSRSLSLSLSFLYKHFFYKEDEENFAESSTAVSAMVVYHFVIVTLTLCRKKRMRALRADDTSSSTQTPSKSLLFLDACSNSRLSPCPSFFFVPLTKNIPTDPSS